MQWKVPKFLANASKRLLVEVSGHQWRLLASRHWPATRPRPAGGYMAALGVSLNEQPCAPARETVTWNVLRISARRTLLGRLDLGAFLEFCLSPRPLFNSCYEALEVRNKNQAM